MGKSCIRFRTIEDIPLDEILRVVHECTAQKLIDYYEQVKGIGRASS